MLLNRERIQEVSVVGKDIVLAPSVPSDYTPPLPKGTPVVVPGARDYFVTTFIERLRSDDDPPHTRWKDCEHYKLFFEPTDVAPSDYPRFSVDGASNVSWTGLADTKELVTLFPGYVNPPVGLHSLLTDRPDGGFVNPPPDLDVLISRSLNAMLPDIKAKLSSVNSLIELKDFVSLPRTLKRITSFVLSLVTSKKKLLKLTGTYGRIRRSFGSSSATLREALGASSDAYLQAEFNILPLLSDIAGIQTALSTVDKVVRNLVARQGKRQRRHFTFRWFPNLIQSPSQSVVNWYDLTSVSNGHVNVPYGGILGSYSDVNYSESLATFHSEIEYNYYYTRFQVEHARLLGLLDSLGVNLNPAIIWNAIPWSFIVDWVFGVSRWLDNRKFLNMEPVTNITRYLWSWNYMRTRSRTIYSYATWPHAVPLHLRRLPHVYESVYRRSVGIPVNNSVILSGLSLKELSLGAALFLSRKPRINRGRKTTNAN